MNAWPGFSRRLSIQKVSKFQSRFLKIACSFGGLTSLFRQVVFNYPGWEWLAGLGAAASPWWAPGARGVVYQDCRACAFILVTQCWRSVTNNRVFDAAPFQTKAKRETLQSVLAVSGSARSRGMYGPLLLLSASAKQGASKYIFRYFFFPFIPPPTPRRKLRNLFLFLTGG